MADFTLRPRSRQRGAGMLEYSMITAVVALSLVVPFTLDSDGPGSLCENVESGCGAVVRLMNAVKRKHAGYLYAASLPSMPLEGGWDSTAPPGSSGTGIGNPDGGDASAGSGGGNSAGGDTGDGSGGAQLPDYPRNPGNPGGAGGSGPGGGDGGHGGNDGPGAGGSGDAGTGGGSAEGGDGAQDGGGGDAPGDPSTWPEWTIGGIVGLGAAAEAHCRLLQPGEAPELTDEDQWAFNAARYSYEEDPNPGFQELGIRYDTGFGQAGEDPPGDFSAILVAPDDPANGTWVLAFRGTVGFDDWQANATQAIFGYSRQYEYARRLAQDVQFALQLQYPGADLLLAGHSLGGGLASAAAHRINGAAVTFNSAGLHPWYRSGAPQSIRDHYIPGEILTTLQGVVPVLPRSVGERIAHPVDCAQTDMIGRHALHSFTALLAGYCLTPDGAGKPECAALAVQQSDPVPGLEPGMAFGPCFLTGTATGALGITPLSSPQEAPACCA